MRLVSSIIMSSLLVVTLSGCSSFKEHTSGLLTKGDNSYLKAQSGRGIQVPPNLSANKVGDEFSIPIVTSQGPVPVSVTPPGGISKQVPPGYVPPPKPQSKSNYFLKPLFK